MGLGAYLAAVTDRDHYLSEEKREREEVRTKPEDEREEIYEIMDGYGIGRDASKAMVDCLCLDHDNWVRVSIKSFLKWIELTPAPVHDGLRTQARETECLPSLDLSSDYGRLILHW